MSKGRCLKSKALHLFISWLTRINALLSEQFSDEDGGEFSDEKFSDSELDSDDNEESASAARQHALENLVPGIDPSEYGRMPTSFYDRSQRVAPPKPASDPTEIETVESAKEGSTPAAGSRPVRPPILARDSYEGVDSDDDTEEDELVDEEEEEEKPQLVGEIEVDMAEEEEEFLEFSRQTLGISDDQWQQILQERRDKGGKSLWLTHYLSFTLSQHSFLRISRMKVVLSQMILFANREPRLHPNQHPAIRIRNLEGQIRIWTRSKLSCGPWTKNLSGYDHKICRLVQGIPL